MTERSIKFKNALLRCELAYKKNPMYFPFESLIRQLKYLIELEEGKNKDLSQLHEIKIGWIAVRELDGYEDQELIDLLCAISHEAEAILADIKTRRDKK